MKDNEKFARLNIENAQSKVSASQDSEGGWKGQIPGLNYWDFRFGKKVMTQEQSEFYSFLKDCIRKGIKVDVPQEAYSYLSLFKDELVKRYNSRQTKDKLSVLKEAKILVTDYDYSGSDLDEIFKLEALQMRNIRLNRVKKMPPALWIAPGQAVETDGRKLTRGGFYFGTHLLMTTFDVKRQCFNKKSEPVEGPVIPMDLSAEKFSEGLLDMSTPMTFSELAEVDRSQIITWLEGGALPREAGMAYYLSGLEFRLLLDSTTTDDERQKLIGFLEDLYRELETANHPSKTLVINLMDFTIARFFPEKATDLVSADIVTLLERTNHIKALMILEKAEEAGKSLDYKIDLLVKTVRLPKEIPEIYHIDIRAKLERDTRSAHSYRRYQSFNIAIRETDSLYQVIHEFRGYRPAEPIAAALKQMPRVESSDAVGIYHSFMVGYNSLMNQLNPFVRVVRNGADVLARMRSLPYWLDSSYLPGVKEATEWISPEKGERYKALQASDILERLGLRRDVHHIDYDDGYVVDNFLNRLRLTMVPSPLATQLKIKPDDTVCITSDDSVPIPNRGTIHTCLFLMAWLVQADGAVERDFTESEDWLADTNPKAPWLSYAKIYIKWLFSHKLTMTAKRKVKVAVLQKYTNRREEIRQLLLRLLLADGNIPSPKRMKRLETIYPLLGLNPANIHSDLHRLATTGKLKKIGTAKTAPTLSREKLQKMQKDTEKAQEMLADVFADEVNDKTATKPKKPKRKTQTAATSPVFILKELMAKEEWPRNEFDELCRNFGLIPNSLLESLNDLSYERLDTPVADDDGETIWIDIDVAKELAAQQ